MYERFRSCRVLLLPILISLAALFLANPTGAHFLLNLNVRVVHVEHLEDGLRIYLRMPMPYLVADKLGEAAPGTLPKPAPYTTNAREDNQVVHFVDLDAVADDPLGLAQIAADGLSLTANGARLKGEVEAMRLYRVGAEPGFATLSEARSAMRTAVLPKPPLYVGDTVVDTVIRYRPGHPVTSYNLASTLDPGLPDQDMTANLILDYGGPDPQIFRARGLMKVPVHIARGTGGGFASFVVEGVRHILEGLDHVLFVICLVIGATRLHSLLWRATGFTLGHSVTLALGFFGFVPSGAWFVPAVETGIALSIIYAAIVALRSGGAEGVAVSEGRILLVTTLIGLLHGLGFSFVLHEILQVTAPNIWQSLLAFNVGVEVGQVMIILAVWPAMTMLRRASQKGWNMARATLAVACIGIAGFWSVERLGGVVSALSQTRSESISSVSQ